MTGRMTGEYVSATRTGGLRMIGDYEKMPAQQGWQCPICGRVYSPTTMMCLYCGNEKESISTTCLTTGTIDYVHHEGITKAEGEG